MNILIENGTMFELPCGSNFAYVLNNNSLFMPTQYKVLQNQKDIDFVSCVRMLYNGKVQFYYMPEGLKSFSSLFPTLTPESFLAISESLIRSILQVQGIGFMDCENIDISFDKVFVDTMTNKVSLVYVPVTTKLHPDYYAMENELRAGLIKLINSLVNLSSPKTLQFSVDLANGTLGLDDLAKRIKGTGGGVKPIEPGPVSPGPLARPLILTALNGPEKLVIRVDKDPFVIGKSVEADGVVSFNQYVGRKHCRIEVLSGQFFAVDLNSKNSTYINKAKLQPNRPYPLNNGDTLTLANLSFQVKL